MPNPELTRKEFIKKEAVSSSIHGIATLFSIAGLVVLVEMARRYGTIWHLVSFSIYGATLVLLYLTSTLYHGLKLTRARSLFRILDHSAIFLLIAGTYTPFLLVNLRGPWGWSMFGVEWGLAVLGVVFKVFFAGRLRIISTGIYLLMGWLIVVTIKPLVLSLPWTGSLLILVGGLLYTGGVVFYHRRDFFYHHAVWHLCVILGSLCCFLAILWYVLPAGPK